MTDDEFAALWNSCATLAEFCERSGWDRDKSSSRAWRVRNRKGIQLKFMQPPRFAAKPAAPTPMCRHCNKHPGSRSRRLCCACFKNEKIRAKYPARYVTANEPTEAELDAMIADGLANKPEWWNDSTKAMEAGRDEE